MPGEREELRHQLRTEQPLARTALLVRGGPDTIERLRKDSERTARRYCLDGEPLLGISVSAVSDMPLDEMLHRPPFYRFREIYVPTVARLQEFRLLPTFRRPHFTVRLQRADDPELARFLAALGSLQDNAGYAKRH